MELSQRAAGATPVDQASVPPHLLCSSCSKPLFNSFQTPHGCRLCQPCVTNLLSPSERRRCPGNTEACRDDTEDTEVSQETCFPDMATRREVARLQVRCPNSDAGCSETLRWGQVDSHVESCHFQTLNCELCNEQVLRKMMQHHVTRECEQRKVKCDQCSLLVTFSEMKNKHRNLECDACCMKFSAHCPHCGDRRKKLSRRDYVLHLSECPESPVDCKYSHLGCSAKIRRSEVQDHYRNSSDAHLELVEAKLRQVTAAPQIVATSSSTAADSREVADVKRRVGSVFEQFKKLQVNVANWAHSTLEIEQMAERFGGVSQLRTLLTGLEDRTRRLETGGAAAERLDQMQQQMLQMQQQVQQMQQQVQHIREGV